MAGSAAHEDHGAHKPTGWTRWVYSTNHKDIGTHGDRKTTTNDAGNDREDQIERADILVVGRINPARQACRLMGAMVLESCRTCHQSAPVPH